MCGLIASFPNKEGVTDPAGFSAGLQRLAARGPDGEGIWAECGVTLGHRRLAILDLDDRAAQPMASQCGRYVIVYNGEIYNFRELRHQLKNKGVNLSTESDSEVLIALFAEHGEAMITKLQGMFAFVIWDRLNRQAFAARDPYGIKPLYVGTHKGGVLIASQVKAIMSTGMVSYEPDLHGQVGFWMLGSVPEPNTWYRDVKAVRAGHCLWIKDGHIASNRRWYDVADVWRRAANCSELSASQIREIARASVKESVNRHLVSDVPVGVFLSGGIDSGALVALVREAGLTTVQGVTVAFNEYKTRKQDEVPGALALASSFEIRHKVRYVTNDEFLNDLPSLLNAMDQPSLDGVNTWFAAKAAAEQGLKVVLSGVGGDELFLGYPNFRSLPRIQKMWKHLSMLPGAHYATRCALEFQAARSANDRWRYVPDWLQSVAGAWWLSRSIFTPREISNLLDGDMVAELFSNFSPEDWIADMCGPLPDNATIALAQIESTTYLRNQLLRDTDWAGMAHGVEIRTPFVDAQLLNNIAPIISALSSFPNKELLADSPALKLPGHLLQRKKTGFSIPLYPWLRQAGLISEGVRPVQSWARLVASTYSQSQAPSMERKI